MRAPRAGLRRIDAGALRAVTTTALALLCSIVATAIGGAGLGLGVATGALVIIVLRRSHHDAGRAHDALDIDSAIVGRALARARAPSDEERRLIVNASHSVRSSVHGTLRVVRAGLRAHSVIVLWSRSRLGDVKVREADTCEELIAPGPFDVRDGLLARIDAANGSILMNDVDSVPDLLPWYPGPPPVSSVMGAALRRDGIPLGYLIVDRAAGSPPFDDIDLIAVKAAAEQIAVAIHLEFLVLEATTAQQDMHILGAAAASLNSALTTDDVCRVAQRLLREFVNIDSFIVSEVDADSNEQEVIFADGDGADGLLGLRFSLGDDLASSVVRCGECLPYNGRNGRDRRAVVGAAALPNAVGLLTFPLRMGQEVFGTLTIASNAPEGFDNAPRNQMGILVHQIAAALSNALAYSRMVRMATTDGMTGLTNHRTFKERGAEALARADRNGRPLTLILTDIDHFKAVNDTHGHAVGDEVIRAVANVLARSARNVDITARYGGEEFAILLEETDVETAVQIAERIRVAVRALRFDGVDGEFSVTLSLGIALHAGGPIIQLVEEADAALYTAKRGGRDRVCVQNGAVVDAA